MENPIWAIDEKFKNIWEGEQGIIIGRGRDNYQPKNDKVFRFPGRIIGCNTAYRVYDNLDALVWIDYKVYTNDKGTIRLLDCLKFAIDPYEHNYGPYNDLIYGLHAKKPEKCAVSFDDGFYPCNLSGYIALNLALILGLNPIWLHGFHANHEPIKKRSESFQIIAQWAKENNRQIYLTSKDSHLTKFFDYKAIPKARKKLPKSKQFPKYETVCIVGHGASVEGADLGNLIDGHDCVIRMANCEWQENTADWGHRYDYGIYCPKQEKYSDDVNRLPKFGYFCYKPMSIERIKKLSYKEKPAYFIGDIVEEWRGNSRFLSRGTAAVIIALELFKPGKITLIGFDQVKCGEVLENKHPKPLQEIYDSNHPKRLEGINNNQPKDRHDWANENETIKNIIGHYGVNIEFLP